MPIPQARDLFADGRTAKNNRVPVLLVVTQATCTHCMRLKKAVIHPMILSGEYEDKVIIRELSMDPEVEVRAFDGELRGSRALAQHYDATVTPTVLLLGANGELLHEPMVGVNTVEMYGYYLDKAIDAALQALRSEPSVSAEKGGY